MNKNMKRILLFSLIFFSYVCLKAQPLTCNIKINSVPINTDVLCVGDDDLLDGSPSGGTAPYTSSWTGGGGQLAPVNAQIATFNASTPGVFTVVYHVTDAASNTATDTIVITVNSLPNLFTSSSQVICSGSCTNLTSMTTNGDGLIWSKGSIGGPLVGSGPAPSLTVNVCPTVTTDYYAISFISTSGCLRTKKVTVVVIDITLPTTATPNPLCRGNTGQLQVLPDGGLGPYSYAWTPTQHMNNPGIYNPLVTPDSNTTYTVVVTDQGSGCTATAHITDTVNPQHSPVLHRDTMLCYGVCTNLWATGDFHNFNWSTGQNHVDTIHVCPLNTTVYTVTMTDSTGCTATDNATISVNPQLHAHAGPDQISCHNDSVYIGQPPFSANGGLPPYTYSWSSNPAGFTSTSAMPHVYPTVTTTYYLTVTDSLGCTDKDSVVVVSDPALIAHPGTPQSMCLGFCHAIGGSPTATGGTGPYFYNWSPATGLDCTNCANPNACPTTTTTYFLTVTDNLGCTDTTHVVVTIYPLPVANAGSPNPQTICSGNNVTLGGSPTASGGTPGYSYSWTSNPGSFTSTSANPIVTPLVTTTYHVTVTDSHGCTAVDSILINVNSSPTASAGANQSICYGTCVQIGGSPTATGGTPGYTYNWSPAGSLSPGGDVANPTACPLSTTTYHVTVTDTIGCTSTSSVTITVKTVTPGAIANPSTICEGSCSTITASGGGTYEWSTPPGGSTTSINVCPTVTTIYTVTVTAVNGCTATAADTVKVLPVSVTATPTTNPICKGDCTDITATGIGTFQWSNPPGGTNAVVNVCPLSNTTYTVTITAPNGCTAAASATVNVNSVNPTATSTPAEVCQGDCSTITASGGGTYQWANPPGGTSPSNTVCPFATTVYTVTVTGLNGCSATTSTTVTVNSATATVSPAVICLGQSANITASGGVSYVWNTVPAQTTPTINVSPLVITQYCVTVTDVHGCTASACDTVTVNSVTPTATASPVSICPGGSSLLTATGGTSYQWSNGLGTTPSVTVTPAATTTYTVTVTGNGCSNTAHVTVTVNTLSVTAIASPDPICIGDTARLITTGGGTYQWCCGLGTNDTVTVFPATTTTYTVTITNGCSATASVTLTVNSATATITTNPSTICAGSSSVLTATGGGTYLWSPGGSTSASLTVFPADTTTYCVTVTAANGCTATACTTVNVNQVPVATITPSTANICTGTSATLTATGGGTYLWSPGGSTSDNIVVSPLSSTIYTVTVSSNGCSDIATATVNVVTAPVAAINTSANPICFGESTTITASGGDNYQWSNPPGGTNPVITVTPATTTTYTVTVTGSGCTAATTDNVTIVVNTIPVPTAVANPNPVCNGNNITLTAGGGATYQWSNPPGGNNPVVVTSPTTNTTYTVTVTSAFNCSATASVSVVVNDINATVAATPPTICEGLSTTLTATGGSTYLWTGGYSTPSIVVSPSSTSTYFVTATDVNGCSQILSVVVTVNPAPLAQITASEDSICAGSNSTLTASGGVSYLWNTGDTTPSVTVSPASTTTYTVTVTGANGCEASTSTSIFVTPIPTITLVSSDPDNTICQGQCVSFTAFGAPLFSFYLNGTLVQGPGGANTYTSCALNNNDVISVSGAINGCIGTASPVTMNVHPNPAVTITSAIPPTVCGACDGSITELTTGGTNPGPPQWSNPPGGNTATISNLCSGVYGVTVTDIFGCFGQASTTLIDPNAPPMTLTSNDPDDTICAGECPVFTANGAANYQFYINTTSVQGPGPSNTFTACNLNNGDSIYVKGIDVLGCTGFTNVIHETVNALPFAYTITGGGQFCQGGTGVPVGLNGSQNGVMYQLFLTVPPNPPVFAGSPIPGNGGAIWFPNQVISGNYSVMAINSTTLCQNNMIGSTTIVQNPLPSQFLVTGGGVFCPGGNGVLVGLSNTQGSLITYQLWVDPGTGAIPENIITGNSNPVSFGYQTIAGTYTVIATNSSTTCSVQMNGSVNVNTSAAPVVFAVTGGGSYCSGTSGVLVGLSGSALGVNYQLHCNGNLAGVAQPGQGTAFNFGYFTTPGTYTVTAVNAATGCSSNMSGNTIVNITIPPTANAGIDQTICRWSSVTLNGSGAGVNGTYHWSPSISLSADNIANPIANPSTTTSYYLTVTDTIGCKGIDTVVINVLPFSLPQITASDTGFCAGTAVNATLDAGNYASYAWNTTPVQTTEIIQVTNAGNYVVTVTAANGCSATDNISVINYPAIAPPVILADGSTHFCQPDSIKLYLNNLYYTYNWSSGSDNTAEIWATQTQNYYVTVSDFYGCTAQAGPLAVTVDPLPVAVISWVDLADSLKFEFYSYSHYATTFNWNFGDPNSGVNNLSENASVMHKFSNTGTYTVQLIVTNNCGSDTAIVTVVVHKPISGINEQSGIDNIVLYPNPSNNVVNLDFTLGKAEKLKLTISDALGRQVYSEKLNIPSGKFHKELDMTDLPVGIYLLRLETDTKIYNNKIIKN